MDTRLISRRIKQGLHYLLLSTLLIVAVVIAIDRWISLETYSTIYTPTDTLPHYDVAVVLGTSKYLGKQLNSYYTNRINAAINLYHHGALKHLLLSGDNAHRSYNEPWTMKRDLLRAGVPETSIALDYAGFRTLDSIVRARKIFDTNHFLIITQGFHCERALFIARYHDIDAACLAVPGPSGYAGFYVKLRELFARVKAVLDLYILNAQPKFLGPKEPIVIQPNNNIEPYIEPLPGSGS